MTLENDRRDRGGQRVPFEALVVVASQKDSAGAYECEAVDVSERGMHLRTAYLPEVGQGLTFRFDTGGGEVIAEGMVQWREEQAKGGEFGVKFTKLDDPALASIRELCGISADGSLDIELAKTQKGSRVRLHIDGLGAPMRARVRDAHLGEVLVGSNLDFLRVGKPLELEDVERGKKRAAVVDRVDVEIDPTSKVPQLVVTLRYDEDAASIPVGAQAIVAAAPAAAETKRTAEPAKESKASSSAKKEPQVRVASVAKADSSLSDEDNTPKIIEDADEDENTQARFAERAKELAAQVGPKLSAFSISMKEKVSSMVARVRERRAGGAEGADDAVEAKDSVEEQAPVVRPRRVTAPPPSGGLTASGRSVVRTEREESQEPAEVAGIEETDENVVKIRRKQRIMIAAAASVLLLIGGVFASRGSAETPSADEATAAAGEALTAPVAAAVVPAGTAFGTQQGAGANNAAGLNGDAITANVPLFGTTPLSTTELAPLPVPAASAAPVLAANEEEGSMDGSDDEAAADEDAPKGATSFGKGTVTKPRRVGLKMDSPISEIKGSTSSHSFSIVVPGRRNIEPASVLAKRDKRLTSVKAVPKDGGTVVTFTFKDGVPPFMAKANGKMLEIELGQQTKHEDGDEVASKKKGKKHQAVAKKEGNDKKKKTASTADKKKHKDKKKVSAEDLEPPRRVPSALDRLCPVGGVVLFAQRALCAAESVGMLAPSRPSLAHHQTLAALRLSRLPGVGAASFRALIDAHGTPEDALAAYLQRGLRTKGERAKSGTREGLRLAASMLEAGSLCAMHIGGDGYPQRCLALGEPPPVLFLRGSTSALLGRSLAIVGARAADAEAMAEACRFAAMAAEAGCVVISGGARGIDAAAHRGALGAGGETVAVLGTGLDVVYPPEHGALFDDIAACGALVTELLPGAPPMASFFLTRNRIIAALSHGVVLVRGDSRSGAITTARWAMKLGRPVAVVEARGRMGEAGRLLASRGATVLSSPSLPGALGLFLASLPA